ncbi:HEAT repeat domain-containing protein [Aggregatilinea lenta]|uniref:HEAT repeat domain-containing protein n=1 Tax=Aggregatilinea lenta TaxID=913108 RepID=UPI000E5B4063|nr:HEAT repeat domain-containing protein [Aggregatilinea lenta]
MTNTNLLIDNLANSDLSCSENAKSALIAMGRDAVDPLLEELSHADAKRRWEIIIVLTKIRDPRAIPAVAEHLRADHGALRVAAAQCLGEIGDQQATGALLRAVDENRNSGALIWILQALGRLKDDRAIDVLVDVMQHTDSTAVRYTAIEALGLIGDRRVIETIRAYRDDESGHVRSRVEVALERLGYNQSPSASGADGRDEPPVWSAEHVNHRIDTHHA